MKHSETKQVNLKVSNTRELLCVLAAFLSPIVGTIAFLIAGNIYPALFYLLIFTVPLAMLLLIGLVVTLGRISRATAACITVMAVGFLLVFLLFPSLLQLSIWLTPESLTPVWMG